MRCKYAGYIIQCSTFESEKEREPRGGVYTTASPRLGNLQLLTQVGHVYIYLSCLPVLGACECHFDRTS